MLQRLRKKKFDETVVRKTVDFLKEKEFINDVLFAKAWLNSRLKKNLGIKRVRQELELKGIDRQVIDSHINDIRKTYSETDVVRSLVNQRMSKSKAIEPQKARRRLYSYLLRRGFSPGIILEVMNQE